MYGRAPLSLGPRAPPLRLALGTLASQYLCAFCSCHFSVPPTYPRAQVTPADSLLHYQAPAHSATPFQRLTTCRAVGFHLVTGVLPCSSRPR